MTKTFMYNIYNNTWAYLHLCLGKQAPWQLSQHWELSFSMTYSPGLLWWQPNNFSLAGNTSSHVTQRLSPFGPWIFSYCRKPLITSITLTTNLYLATGLSWLFTLAARGWGVEVSSPFLNLPTALYPGNLHVGTSLVGRLLSISDFLHWWTNFEHMQRIISKFLAD